MPMSGAINGDPDDLRRGGFPAWPLPLDAAGAGVARSLVKTMFGVLGMPSQATYDVAVAISELATNAYVHALGGDAADPGTACRPELWAYLRWGTRPEVVLKVFDTALWRGPFAYGPTRPPPESEGGRGLEVVHALTAEYGGHWGMQRTRARLGARAALGKAVFLTLPIPPGCPAALLRPLPSTPQEVVRRVYGLVTSRGLGRVQATAGHGMAVICLRAGVHVWVHPDSLTYRLPGRGRVRHSLCDAVEVVEQVVAHCADVDARGR